MGSHNTAALYTNKISMLGNKVQMKHSIPTWILAGEGCPGLSEVERQCIYIEKTKTCSITNSKPCVYSRYLHCIQNSQITKSERYCTRLNVVSHYTDSYGFEYNTQQYHTFNGDSDVASLLVLCVLTEDERREENKMER